MVTNCKSDCFTIDIGLRNYCSLPCLSFENATKQNKPSIGVGDLVYAKIYSNIPNSEIILTCVNLNNKANGLGKLNEAGSLVELSIKTCEM